jgi:DNA mismatch endonuclease, patch repair protein
MRESSKLRSRIMRAVKGRDTGPELAVRSLAHRLGYRFRVHRADLPGKPDLVFPRLRRVIFVHGCFWHGHNCARGARVPKRHRAYWVAKIARNKARDDKTVKNLENLGWKSLIVWECSTQQNRARSISRFLA